MNGQFQGTLKYFDIGRIAFLSRAAYPMGLLSRSFTIVLRVWIFYAVYAATFAAVGTTTIGGLTLAQTLWILALSQSFQSSTRPPSVSSLVQEEIQSGQFAYTVTRPYSYIGFHLANHLGRAFPTLLFNLITVSLLLLALVGPVQISLESLALGSLLLLCGLILDFFMTFCIGLAALWIEETFGLFVIFQRIQMVFGGQILPLSMFPGMLRQLAEALPFAHLFYTPCLVVVAYSPTAVLPLVLIQAIWLVVLICLTSFLFRRGMKVTSVNGG
jgi:ABC-2 type transport system permease protein